MRHLIGLGVLFCVLLAPWTRAEAHPHVWVSVKTEVLYRADGAIAGLRHRWSFDELYSTYAVDGLDKNGDGAYDEAELAELAKINVESLKEFDYFTFGKIEDSATTFGAPTDYRVSRDEAGILTLEFTLPMAEPVVTGGLRFSFAVYDPSYFIAFGFAETQPLSVSANAPAGCRAELAPDTTSEATAAAAAEALAAVGESLDTSVVQTQGSAIVLCGS